MPEQQANDQECVFRKITPDDPDFARCPGAYVYKEEFAEEIRARDAYLWNVVAVERLKELCKRLNIVPGIYSSFEEYLAALNDGP